MPHVLSPYCLESKELIILYLVSALYTVMAATYVDQQVVAPRPLHWLIWPEKNFEYFKFSGRPSHIIPLLYLSWHPLLAPAGRSSGNKPGRWRLRYQYCITSDLTM